MRLLREFLWNCFRYILVTFDVLATGIWNIKDKFPVSTPFRLDRRQGA